MLVPVTGGAAFSKFSKSSLEINVVNEIDEVFCVSTLSDPGILFVLLFKGTFRDLRIKKQLGYVHQPHLHAIQQGLPVTSGHGQGGTTNIWTE